MEAHNLIITFGKHKGQRWTRLPVSYLKWLINEGTQYADIAKAELKRRGTVLEYEIEISGHAIDRASLSCRKIWHKTKRNNEGIHTWLHRMSCGAIKSIGSAITKDHEKIEYNGMKFAFKFGEIYPTLLTVMPRTRINEKK